jgi:hypothetical protein
MNIIRNALWRALIYVGVVIFITLLPLGLTLIARGNIEPSLSGSYAVLFDNAITFLPLALIAAATTDYFFMRSFRLKKESEGLLTVLIPFVITTLMYWEFYTIRAIRSPGDVMIPPLAIVQGLLVCWAIAYAILLKYLMFASEREIL